MLGNGPLEDEIDAADRQMLVDLLAAGEAGYERAGVWVHGRYHDNRAIWEGGCTHMRRAERMAEEGVCITI